MDQRIALVEFLFKMRSLEAQVDSKSWDYLYPYFELA